MEAFGYPLSQVLATSGNFTTGIVTALAGIGDDSRFYQISAPVQPGNSCGPLLDENGNLIGVVSSKRTRPVKATCRIAGVREIVGPLIWELMGKRDDGDNPFRFRAAPALDDG